MKSRYEVENHRLTDFIDYQPTEQTIETSNQNLNLNMNSHQSSPISSSIIKFNRKSVKLVDALTIAEANSGKEKLPRSRSNSKLVSKKSTDSLKKSMSTVSMKDAILDEGNASLSILSSDANDISTVNDTEPFLNYQSK